MKRGMFTAEGAKAVEAIVTSAQNGDQALERLELLAKAGVHKEAADTAVRESVWSHFNPSPTHVGGRLRIRGKCEVCGVETNWTVGVSGRRAYWCGCGD